MASISSAGIGSGLDINGLVAQLIELEKRPLLALDRKEAGFQAKISAYGTLKGALSALQTSAEALGDLSKFQVLKATPGNTSVFSATAGSGALPGTYSVEVTALAKAQKLVAVGQASDTAAIGTGTLTIEFGTISGGTFDTATGKYTGATFTNNGSSSKSVVIDSSTNSLTGIRDAINKANIGVTASIVNDGGASPYRLTLTSSASGAANSLRISVSGDAALSTLLAHDPAATQSLSETVTAQNASFKVDGVTVTKSSNSVSDVISGVTMTLLGTNSGSPTTLSVTRDTAAIKSSVEAFVKAYNDAIKNLKDLTAYNATAKKASVLQGDASARSLESQLKGTLTAAVKGLTGAYRSLSDVGVAFQRDGTLKLDTSKLDTALAASAVDVGSVFAAAAKTSDSLVSFVSGTDKTKGGTYAVAITQLATRGETVGSAAAGLTITAGSNDVLTLTVDGVSGSVTLAAATYGSASALAAEVQAKINSTAAFSNAGVAVTVTESGGVITITSNRYGSGSNVTVTGGNGQTNLVGSTPTATAGVDVAGTINGQSALGSGQFLTGSGGDSEGLKLQVLGGATGARGWVDYSRGYAYELDKALDSLLGASGPITSRTDGLNRSIEEINDRREVLNRRLEIVEARYRAQFEALDTLVSSLRSTSDYLTRQLDNLPKFTNER